MVSRYVTKVWYQGVLPRCGIAVWYLQNPKNFLSIVADKQLYCNFLHVVLACLQLYNAYSQL